jgi:hypothetical protein
MNEENRFEKVRTDTIHKLYDSNQQLIYVADRGEGIYCIANKEGINNESCGARCQNARG